MGWPAFSEDGFWTKVDIQGPNDCWLWTRGRTGSHKGAGQYGRTRYYGVADLTHRVAYRLAIGDIPDGLHVLHHCDTPLCCNPAHLRTGTVADNMRDKVERGRQRGWPKGVSRKAVQTYKVNEVRP